MGSLGRRERTSFHRAVGWRPQPLAGRYDIVVIGGGALAAATAWTVARTAPGTRVAVLAPQVMGASWHPGRAARLHALRLPPSLRPLVTRSAVRYRAWADQLAVDPPSVRGGHLALATTVESRAALSQAALATSAWRPVSEAERADLLVGHDRQRCLAGWHEPLATTMEAGDLVFRLAEAAAARGVDVVDAASVQRVERTAGGFRLHTAAGTTDTASVIDVDPTLGVGRGAGLRGAVVTMTHQLLTTEALAPLLGVSVTLDEVLVSQRVGGAVDIVAPAGDPCLTPGLVGSAVAVAHVVRTLPLLRSASVVARQAFVEALAADGLPVIGPLRDGLWVGGSLGVHRLDLLPAVAESLAYGVLSGTPDAGLAAFDPLRPEAVAGVDAVPDGPLWVCAVCGPRPRAEFTHAGGSLLHRGGCGRPLARCPVPLRRSASATPPVAGPPTPAPGPSAAAVVEPLAARPVAARPVAPSRGRRRVSPPVAVIDLTSAGSEPVPAAVQADGSPIRPDPPGPRPARAGRMRPPAAVAVDDSAQHVGGLHR